MRRLIFIAGIVLIIFAWADLILLIIAPAIFMPIDNAPLLKGIIQAAVCKPGEVLSAQYSTYSTPGESSTSIDMACVDSQQNARDVSQQILSAGAVGYLVPFLVGLFTAMLARPSGESTNKAHSSVNHSNPAHSTSHDPQMAARMEAGRKARLDESPLDTSTFQHSRTQDGSDHIPLATRLKELNDAYSSGLMTKTEYQAKHKALIDES